MGMEQLIDKSKHLIFERDTYQANIKALQQDMKDKKRIVLFVGAGINLGGNNDIDISWNGLLNMMLKDALSILTAEKRYTTQERERLESLLCSSKRISQRTEEEQLLWETLHGTVEGEFTCATTYLLDYDTFVFQLCHTFHLRFTLLSPTKPKKKKKPSITSVSLPYLAITDWVLSLPRSDSNGCPDFL